MNHTATSRTSRGRRRLLASVVAVASLLVTGLSAVAYSASAADPVPHLVVSVSTDTDGLEGGAVPGILADTETSITVSLSLSDNTTLAKGTVIQLDALKQAGAVQAATDRDAEGAIQPAATYKVPAPSAQEPCTATSTELCFKFDVTYSQAVTNLYFVASVKKPNPNSPTPGATSSFDILTELTFVDRLDTNDNLVRQIGATDCTSSAAAKVCAILDLPLGILSDRAALSSGLCNAAAGCGTDEMVQFIAGLPQDLLGTPQLEGYSRTYPATMTLRCDKMKCKGKGVSSYTARISLEATGDLRASPACAVKGQIQLTEEFCTDYVSSKRDNAGDLLLQILFFRDARGMI